MKEDEDYIRENLGRRNPAPGVFRYSEQPTIVYLTIATLKRKPWLASDHTHDLIREVWRDAKAWLVGRYVLMPDHLHLFCAPNDLDTEIETWIRYWKRKFRMRHGNADWKFQSRGWHHRLRGHESYSEKWQYMLENPIRKGLAKELDEWPYQGTVFDLRW